MIFKEFFYFCILIHTIHQVSWIKHETNMPSVIITLFPVSSFAYYCLNVWRLFSAFISLYLCTIKGKVTIVLKFLKSNLTEIEAISDLDNFGGRLVLWMGLSARSSVSFNKTSTSPLFVLTQIETWPLLTSFEKVILCPDESLIYITVCYDPFCLTIFVKNLN